jgi:hypothetical protein
MLIKCPKCGFSQPQDQYCAQCGVDIINFKAPQPSAATKLFKDPVLHLGLVVLIAVVSAVALYRHQKGSIQDRVTYLRGSRPSQKAVNQSQIPDNTATNQNSSALASTDSTQPAVPIEATPPPPPPSDFGQPPSHSPAGPNESLPPAAASTASYPPPIGAGPEDDRASLLKQKKSTAPPSGLATGKGSGLYKVKVTYTEISQRSLESLAEESSKSGQYNNFGDYSAGIILQAQKKLAGISKEMSIQRTDLDPIDLGKPLNWTLNYHASEREPASQDISYSTFINLEEVDNQIFKGNLEIVRSQKEPTETGGSSIQKSNFPAVFEISHDAAFFMSGLGAHRGDTVKADSEFVVLVQFEKVESRP